MPENRISTRRPGERKRTNAASVGVKARLWVPGVGDGSGRDDNRSSPDALESDRRSDLVARDLRRGERQDGGAPAAVAPPLLARLGNRRRRRGGGRENPDGPRRSHSDHCHRRSRGERWRRVYALWREREREGRGGVVRICGGSRMGKQLMIRWDLGFLLSLVKRVELILRNWPSRFEWKKENTVLTHKSYLIFYI